MVDDVRRIRADEWREYRELRLEALKDTPLAFAEHYETSVWRPDDFWRDRVCRAATEATVAGFVAVNGGSFTGMATGHTIPYPLDPSYVELEMEYRGGAGNGLG